MSTEYDNLFQQPTESTAVNVDEKSKITPTSKTEIKDIQADQWHTMNLSQLYDQKTIMEERLFAAANYNNNPEVLRQINQGLQRLLSIIDAKQEITLI